MENNSIDSRITYDNLLEFNKKGWTLVDLKLSRKSINKALKGLEAMKYASIKNDYKPRRIYYDHLLNKNPSAIELPFNKEICNENIKDLFIEAKIGSLVKTLMNWKNPCCDLARLFCMGNYNYRGNWHRDYTDDLDNIHNNSNTRKIILVGIYLLPQKGFRLLKKDFDYKGKNSIIKDKLTDKYIRSFPFPLSPPQNTFHVIDGKVGTALFFDPLLIHQGSNFSDRLDFHMKFCDSIKSSNKKNTFQDFSVIEILHEDFSLPYSYEDINEFANLTMIPFNKRSSLLNRFSNSLDYRTCFRRLMKIRNLKSKKSYKLINKQGWEIDIFSNTIFQK